MIDRKEFAEAIRRKNPDMSEYASQYYAEKWAKNLHPRLEDALNHWIRSEPFDDITCGEYSIKKIKMIKRYSDELQAILLMSEYMTNPERGEALILEGRR